MLENSNIQDRATAKKRETSTIVPKSLTGILERLKIETPRVTTPTPALLMKVNPEPSRCPYCINNKLGEIPYKKVIYNLEEMYPSSCASCELIWNSMPMNNVQGLVENSSIYLAPQKSSSTHSSPIRIHDGESYQRYGRLV